MKVITLLNEKGGVGKTTLAVHIAAGICSFGKNVLLVDTDSQGHAGIALGMPKKPALYDLLIRDAYWKDVLTPIPPERYGGSRPDGLLLLASNIETRGIPLMLNDEYALDTRLRQLERTVDVVVIDTPPTPSLFHVAVLRATDAIIVPTKCETLSFDGLLESLLHVGNANQERSKGDLARIRVLGIVPTMYRPNTLEHAENLKALRERYGDLVWDAIYQRTVWAEASTARKTVFNFALSSEAAREALNLVKRVMENLVWEVEEPA